VADETSKSIPNGPFDVRTVKSLVALMAQHDLSEIALRDGVQRLRIRRGALHAPVVSHVALPQVAPAPVSPAPAAKSTEAAPGRKLIDIKSEAVGTFYAKPNPESPPFVTVGSKVTPSTVICQLEAMKIFNEVQAGVSGTIAEVCVDNQSPVEFGQVLFRVEA
jgi:acetyl-CoA carboxylase biotin carboxyl carrier protein